MGILGDFLGGGGLGLVGDIVGGLFGSSAQKSANKTNVKLAREQRAWEETMSNTAVQRRKADIMAAGGNPALAFTNGQEATTPSVSAPQVEATWKPDWLKGSTLQALMAKTTIDNTNANTAKTLAEADATRALTTPRVDQIAADIKAKAASTAQAEALTRQTEEQIRALGEEIAKIIVQTDGEALKNELARASMQDQLLAIKAAAQKAMAEIPGKANAARVHEQIKDAWDKFEEIRKDKLPTWINDRIDDITNWTPWEDFKSWARKKQKEAR